MGFLKSERPHSRSLGVCVTPEIDAKIKLHAMAKGQSVANLLRQLIEQEVNKTTLEEKIKDIQKLLVREFRERERERVPKGITKQEAVKNASHFIKKRLTTRKIDRKHIDKIVNTFAEEAIKDVHTKK